MIPKIIHYCWLSGDPIPNDYQKYMETWHKYIPDYEFILWDTKRFDINSSLWTKQAFELKQYAFAADYIRLYAIFNFGGIYLDMDIEVVKPFDDLLDNNLILAKENHVLNSIEAGCFGAEKGHPFIKMCLDWFDNHTFDSEKKVPLPNILYPIWTNTYGGADERLFSHDYFTAKNTVTGRIEKTKNTYTIHHFSSKWIGGATRLQRNISYKIHSVFGENKISDFLANISKKIIGFFIYIRKNGFSNSTKYYFHKYLISSKKEK